MSERRLLTEIESKELLREAGIPVIETRLARTLKEAVNLSREIGFPVVVKIASPDIIHKSDVGGVRLGLARAAQVSRACREIVSSVRQKVPAARIDGVSVQKMARPGVELIIGMSQDPQFGPVLMFGLGGILVEIIKDVSFRLVPVTQRDAAEMIKEIKGFPLLEGYRGSEPVDIQRLADLIVNISGFIEKNPHIQELDLNPLYGYRDSVIAVDARIVIDDSLTP